MKIFSFTSIIMAKLTIFNCIPKSIKAELEFKFSQLYISKVAITTKPENMKEIITAVRIFLYRYEVDSI